MLSTSRVVMMPVVASIANTPSRLPSMMSYRRVEFSELSSSVAFTCSTATLA